MKIDCQLCADSDSEHLQQIYTGFSELKRKGFVNLALIKSKRITNSALLEVVVNNKYKVIYDTFDGFNFPGRQGLDDNLSFMSGLLEEVDYYFKRSYSREVVSALKENNKVHPLGLSYYVTSTNNIGNTISDGLRDRCIKSIRNNAFLSRLLGVASNQSLDFEQFEYFPVVSDKPRILFMARAWDPRDCSNCNPHDIETLNKMRADCIRACRKEYGASFLGGLGANDYTRKYFPDVLLADPKVGRKLGYLDIVKESDICIATTGLHNSIGWKLGEYVAASKAIVSEKLHYELPGQFTPRHNYLEFANPEECVQSVRELIYDKALRFTLMINNYRYYNAYLRPDMLVMNSLLKVVGAR